MCKTRREQSVPNHHSRNTGVTWCRYGKIWKSAAQFHLLLQPCSLVASTVNYLQKPLAKKMLFAHTPTSGLSMLTDGRQDATYFPSLSVSNYGITQHFNIRSACWPSESVRFEKQNTAGCWHQLIIISLMIVWNSCCWTGTWRASAITMINVVAMLALAVASKHISDLSSYHTDKNSDQTHIESTISIHFRQR